MGKIQEAELRNKRVLLRVDFNVTVEGGKIAESFKVETAKETLSYLLQKRAKVALISHLGRPEGKISPEFSLGSITQEIEKLLAVKLIFVPDCVGGKVAESLNSLAEGEAVLLENARFYPGEENNDPEFAKRLAENFDVFVNDAFGVSHRDQASVTGVAKILPSYSGLRLQKEIENLNEIRNDPSHPAVAIIGGAKIETKLPMIETFEKIYDHILVGGMIANEAIDQKIKFSEKVMLPVDFAKGRLDIGPDTISKFKEIISRAKTIVWNGPLGKFEEKPYDTGTAEVLDAVIKSGAFALIGGGESVQVLGESDVINEIGFVSTGGGAMLEYLSGKKLPGIEILKM